jgi:aspartyl-tRNA(Asn)/glutamyl-tRNA(Gln) amidotransferase subunit A
MIPIHDLTIEKAHDHLKNGDFTVWELCQAYLENITARNTELNIYLEVFDDIETQAQAAQERFVNGTATLLTGIPFAMKDNMLIEGKQVTAGSKILANYKATYDGTVPRLLKEAGAIFLGRANMDEFAQGSSTENSAFGVTKNPLDSSRVPGGSSGGSAAAVAANMALVSLGSDTGGSIRQPAAFCGLVGLKPTYDTVSRYGLIALASSLDQIGPMTKSVRDAEIIFDTLNKHDPMDATSLPTAMRHMKHDSSNKKIGVPRAFLTGEGIDKGVLENFNASLERMKASGYEIVDIDLPLMPYSLAVYYVLQPAEASSNLSRFDGVKYGLKDKGADLLATYMQTRGNGFGMETRRRILLGTYVLSHGYYDAYYRKAVNVRDQIRAELDQAFESVAIIATPTTPTSAFKIGEKTTDPVQMYLSDIFTVPANIAGNPAISIPSGKNSEGLPYGIQFMAPHFGEKVLFAIGKEFEKSVQ